MSKYPYTYQIVKCQTCGEEILVERILIGTDHTMDIIVSHKECLRKKGVDEKFMKSHPIEAKAIEKWIGER